MHLARPVRGVLAQRLGHELDVERRLHERRERVALALLEGFEQLARDLLEKVREHLRGEVCGRGRDLGVHQDEAEERFVDVWAYCVGLVVYGWCPGGIGNSIADYALEDLDCWASVRLEEPGVDLSKDIPNGFGFFGEFDGEGILELCC